MTPPAVLTEAICRWCGETLREDNGRLVDTKGDEGCPMADQHQAVR